jgi:large conductance mechanosensitive channel
MGLIKEFKEFAMKGNVIDLAVGVVIGAAFNDIVKSVVADLFTPLLTLFGSQPDFSTIKAGPIQIGKFINALISFLIVALALFALIKVINVMKRNQESAPPAEQPADIKLLTEIRDLMKEKQA